MRIQKPYTNKEYADLAIYCNENKCHIEDRGTYLESVVNPIHKPTNEEQKRNREIAYKNEVDPITSHIQRLKDEPLTDEIIREIEELIEERTLKVAEIKQRYPYN